MKMVVGEERRRSVSEHWLGTGKAFTVRMMMMMIVMMMINLKDMVVSSRNSFFSVDHF